MFSTLMAVFLIPRLLEGTGTANATLTYTISSVDALSVSGNPGTLSITAAVAGSNPTSATDSTTTYNVTTNNTSRHIYAVLSSTMPSGVTLYITMIAPSGATSAGAIAVSTTSIALVSGVKQLYASSLTITYTLNATASAAQVSSASNTVTYTIGA